MSLSRMATLNQLPFMIAFEGHVWDEPSGPAAVGWGASDRLYSANDGWFYLASPVTDFRQRLASIEALAGVDEVVDDDLEAWLSERFAARTVDESVDAVLAAGIAAHRYLSIIEASTDPISFAVNAVAIQDHPGLGKALGAAFPKWGNDDERCTLLVARRPGMDTRAILEELGFDAAEILDLMQAGNIAFGENAVVTTTTIPGYWYRPEDILTRASKDSVRKALPRIRDQLTA